jgi:hypothetical protein
VDGVEGVVKRDGIGRLGGAVHHVNIGGDARQVLGYNDHMIRRSHDGRGGLRHLEVGSAVAGNLERAHVGPGVLAPCPSRGDRCGGRSPGSVREASLPTGHVAAAAREWSSHHQAVEPDLGQGAGDRVGVGGHSEAQSAAARCAGLSSGGYCLHPWAVDAVQTGDVDDHVEVALAVDQISERTTTGVRRSSVSRPG